MEFYRLVVSFTTITTGLVAGLFFTFTTIIMPGLSSLTNKDYIKGFKAIDSILQPNPPATGTQPFFAFVFFGSILGLVVSLVWGLSVLDGTGKLLVSAALAVYVLGMIAPTLRVNLPLNNKIQTYKVEKMSDSEIATARSNFEPRWVRWNLVRTLASTTSFVLMVVAFSRLREL